MRAPRASFALVLAGLLLLPLSAALPPPAAPEAPRWVAGLAVQFAPGREPLLLPGGGAVPEGNANGSACQIFAPMELACEGPEVFIPADGVWVMSIGIDVESASNTFVHVVQEVEGRPVFAFSCQSNLTLWLPTIYGLGRYCTTWGAEQREVMTNVRFDVSHLPAAGTFTVGGWHAYMGPS